MNTLTIAQTLINAGLERKPAEAIAQAIDDKNKELITKEYLEIALSNNSEKLFNRLIFSILAVTGISLTIIKLFFLG
ncbi:MAG: hypothetical protein Rsou_0364 [Candidatus Ruthia sp. Asou_11_S2]|nr:hypothetical protein [Candidatus Ruthia sp. Asou_11_S2]